MGIIDRNEAVRWALADVLTAEGYRDIFASADVSVKRDVEGAVAQVVATLRPVNVLFNHAGTILIKPFLETEKRIGISCSM